MSGKKRVGIFTFHNVPNYGAAIQGISFKKYLENKGNFDVRIIDYKCCGNGDEFTVENTIKSATASKNLIKGMVKKLFASLNAKDYTVKFARFQEFCCQYMSLDGDYENSHRNYDYLFYGSDQIWNPKITGGYDRYYFAENAEKCNVVTASLSASCGDIDELENIEEFLDKVKKFDFVSVREKSLCDYLTGKGIKCEHTLDPTFLLSKEEYTRCFNLEKQNEDKYVLIYALRENPQLSALAEKIAKIKNLKIKTICGYFNSTKINDKGIFDAGPLEFLSLFYNADYVITNSFHGAAFSLIFEKNFNVFLPSTRTSRLVDLLEYTDLSARITNEDLNACAENIDYKVVKEKLSVGIENTKKYIDNVLSFSYEGAESEPI